MIELGRRPIATLSLCFAVAYVLLLAAATQTSFFGFVERPVVAALDWMLRAGSHPGESRRIELQRAQDVWKYRIELETDVRRKVVTKTYHLHGYVFVVFAAVILGTPGIPRRSRFVSLAVGAVVCFAIAMGLLLSDVHAWEREALAREPARALAWIAQAFDALHRSSAALMGPVVVWLFWASADGVAEHPRPPRERADLPSDGEES